jgi:hypothetical protein
MAKNYTKILNWDAFPDLDGLKVNHGRLFRQFCKCGHVSFININTCPECGNTKFRGNNTVTNYYVLTNATAGIVCKRFLHYSIEYNEQEATKIIKYDRGEEILLNRASHHLDDVFKALPELLQYPVYKFAYDIVGFMETNFCDVRIGYSGQQTWRTGITLAEKLLKENPKATLNDVAMLTSFFNKKTSVAVKLYSMVTNSRKLSTIYDDLINLPLFVQLMLDDLQVFYQVMRDPNSFNNVDEEIGNFVAAYYRGGYISDSSALLTILNDASVNETTRPLIISFIKEKFADSGYRWSALAKFIEWLNCGNMCENVKDYYMQINGERFIAAFGRTAYFNAIEDIYNHPAQAIINLANLR